MADLWPRGVGRQARGHGDPRGGRCAEGRGQAPGYNLKIFFEGEEEQGSPHLAALLAKHRETLKSDGWVIFDGPSHPSGAPQVSLGVRGDVNVDLTVYGPARPLHSGHYGNWAPNPAMELAQLLASMKDPTGRVTVAGWYDDVVPLTDAEKAAIRAVPPATPSSNPSLGLVGPRAAARAARRDPAAVAEHQRYPCSRRRRKGTECHPDDASATLDLRLVKGNDWKRQVDKLTRHIRTQGLPCSTASRRWTSGGASPRSRCGGWPRL